MSPNPTPALATTQSLGKQLDVVDTPQTIMPPEVMDVNAFVEVSQIAQEAVVHATQQLAKQDTDPTSTSTNISN